MKEIEHEMTAFGLPMGPFALLDVVGLDVSYEVAKILHESYGPRMTPAPLLAAMVAAGRLGTKNGKGFYEYAQPEAGDVDRLMLRVREHLGPQGTLWRPSRPLLAMVNEAALALQEGIASARDIDLAMMAGTGFPKEKEGPLHYADTIGIDAVLRELEELAEEVGPRFWPAPLLRRMVAAGFTGKHAGRGFFTYDAVAAVAA
jgi:3-hydroxyacyl-CoA dehydrogenase/enoyl-CoA hydratase/3-hydroxybutyryl-CoA epimerase